MLEEIYNTLNQIEVKGRENLDRLLGVMMVLEAMLKENKGEEQNGE